MVAALTIAAPWVVDLGYGVTTVELAGRLRHRFPAVRVLGLEIDAERVAAGLARADPPRLKFAAVVSSRPVADPSWCGR